MNGIDWHVSALLVNLKHTPPLHPMQRNSALHQVDVVNERLDLTQQSNKVLQQQIDLFSVRYQMALEDLRKETLRASDAIAMAASTGTSPIR